MSTPMKLDDFLQAQSCGFTATLEAIADKPTHVKVTPYLDEHGCGCASSFELSREMIHSVKPTGTYHFCCGKRLEVAIVEFTENASIPVADLMKPKHHAHDHGHDHGHGRGHEHGHEHGRGDYMGYGAHRGSGGYEGTAGYGGYGGYAGYGGPAFARGGRSARSATGGGPFPPPVPPRGGGPVGLVGRWRIPWSRCSVSCIEVCTHFCSDTGWDCCGWETRCALNCDGPYWDPLEIFF